MLIADYFFSRHLDYFTQRLDLDFNLFSFLHNRNFSQRQEQVLYPRNSGVLVEEINSELVSFYRIFNNLIESLNLPAFQLTINGL